MKNYNLLLSKGYFPKELPPVFTTSSFGKKVDKIVQDWCVEGLFKKIQKKKKPCETFSYELKPAESEIFSIPKGKYERRNLHIVHPLPQALLSMEIGKNWKLIQKWLSRQVFSDDKIYIRSEYERAVKEINFDIHTTKKRYLEATSDWIVKTDVNLFYPSIYTHSIAWAAYGKAYVKSHSTKCSGFLADRIDCLVRSCNGKQTVGIPIGPETSRIVAEILSARIEKEYCENNDTASVKNTTRLQDDWVVGVKSLEEAENVLSTINKVYRTYGLNINGDKTSIDSVISERPSAWISEIQMFLPHKDKDKDKEISRKLTGMWLAEFLDLVLVLQLRNPNDRVVSYALSSIKKEEISSQDIPVIESFLIKSATVAPLSLNHVCAAILGLQNLTEKLSVERIKERFIYLAEVAIEKEHSFEVMWLLYTLRGLEQCIDSKIIRNASAEIQSAAIALVLMDMDSRGLILGKLPVNNWQSQISEDSVLSDWTWLMAYEGIRHGWIADEHNLMEKAFFKPLISQKVKFYDPNKTLLSTNIRKKQATKKRNLHEAKNFLEGVRSVPIIGGDFFDY